MTSMTLIYNDNNTEHPTSPDADRLDAVLGRINRTLSRPNDHLVNVGMIEFLLAVGIKPRIALIAADRRT